MKDTKVKRITEDLVMNSKSDLPQWEKEEFILVCMQDYNVCRETAEKVYDNYHRTLKVIETRESNRENKTKNRIPRKFNKIIGKMLIDTNCDKDGDIVHITKDEAGYHSFNTRTGKTAWANLSIVRNSELLQFIEIQ